MFGKLCTGGDGSWFLNRVCIHTRTKQSLRVLITRQPCTIRHPPTPCTPTSRPDATPDGFAWFAAQCFRESEPSVFRRYNQILSSEISTPVSFPVVLQILVTFLNPLRWLPLPPLPPPPPSVRFAGYCTLGCEGLQSYDCGHA